MKSARPGPRRNDARPGACNSSTLSLWRRVSLRCRPSPRGKLSQTVLVLRPGSPAGMPALVGAECVVRAETPVAQWEYQVVLRGSRTPEPGTRWRTSGRGTRSPGTLAESIKRD